MNTTRMLAKAAGIGRSRMHRLPEAQHVPVYTIGRTRLVPLSEIEEKLPAVWESIRKAEKERATENRSAETFKTDRLPPL